MQNNRFCRAEKMILGTRKYDNYHKLDINHDFFEEKGQKAIFFVCRNLLKISLINHLAIIRSIFSKKTADFFVLI